MELAPNGRVVRSMLVVVTPPVVVSVDVPIGVPSSVKVTLPVGVRRPGARGHGGGERDGLARWSHVRRRRRDRRGGRLRRDGLGEGRRRGQEVGAPAVRGDDGVGCIGVVGLAAA